MSCQLWCELIEDIRVNGKCEVNVFRFIKSCLFSLSVQVLFLYRISHFLDSRLGVVGSYFAFVISWFSQVISGCHLNPKARIAGGVYLPHATGIVIGEGSIVEGNVSIFQHVTLGLKEGANAGYPTLKSGCKVYGGTVIIGAITVGRNSIIGANSFVCSHVSEDSVVAGVPASDIKSS